MIHREITINILQRHMAKKLMDKLKWNTRRWQLFGDFHAAMVREQENKIWMPGAERALDNSTEE